MAELEAVGGLGVTFQPNSVLTAEERRQQHGLLTSSIAFEHDESSTIGRRGEHHAGITPRAAQSVADVARRRLRGGVNKTKGEVREALHAHRRHEDIDGIRALQVLLS